jgi:pimeloyl-ACP methyl ester carboxylesterase
VDWSPNVTTFLEIGHARLECRSWGAPPNEAPTVVMLHEGLGSVAQWKAFPDRLAQRSGYGVFAYSRSGYGRSSPAQLPRPLDYMTREAIDVLPKVLDAIGFERGVLLGHSDGASIGAIYLGTIEDFRVRGLCLMAPHFFVEEVGLKAIAKAKTAFEQDDLRVRLGRYHDDPDNAFRGWNDAWLDPKFKDWNIEEVIAYFRVPTLAIQGKGDRYGTIAQIEALQAQAYSPVDSVILDDCGHAPHLEQPEETLALVAEFLARLIAFETQPQEGA